MKKLFAILIFFCGCSDKYDSVYRAAPAPALSFNADTISVREKDYFNVNNTGILYLHSSPFERQMNMQYNDSSGKVHFKYRGVFLEDSKPVIVAGDSTIVFVSCDKPGTYTVDIYLTDQLGKTDSRKLIVQCNPNQRIKTALSAVLIDSSLADNWYYQFDGSGCIKTDGKITAYHFTVNGSEMHTNVPYFFWTFHARGEQTVSLYATDDLLQLSDTTTIKIMIP